MSDAYANTHIILPDYGNTSLCHPLHDYLLILCRTVAGFSELTKYLYSDSENQRHRKE